MRATAPVGPETASTAAARLGIRFHDERAARLALAVRNSLGVSTDTGDFERQPAPSSFAAIAASIDTTKAPRRGHDHLSRDEAGAAQAERGHYS